MTKVVPVLTPVNIPVAEPTVAIAVLPLVHAPPVEASYSGAVVPGQTEKVPVMVDGSGFTYTVFVVNGVLQSYVSE